MKQLMYIRISDYEGDLIINEYDGDKDKTLDFNEFCAMFLPSTNNILKEIALNRTNV
jgi:Ca2+-binding EF-hand superfamily protein